ncbi:MAG: hypothetical protein ACTSVK_06390 [Promethearchaeota archaeon]
MTQNNHLMTLDLADFHIVSNHPISDKKMSQHLTFYLPCFNGCPYYRSYIAIFYF